MNETDKYLIRKVYDEELDEAFTLIWNVFQQFVASDYTEEGIDYFYGQFVVGQNFRDKFLNGLQTMYGAFDDRRIVGVLSISADNHVSCVFVDEKYQRKGKSFSWNSIYANGTEAEIKALRAGCAAVEGFVLL